MSDDNVKELKVREVSGSYPSKRVLLQAIEDNISDAVVLGVNEDGSVYINSTGYIDKNHMAAALKLLAIKFGEENK